MSAVLHRIEALPGDGRYALTFRVSAGGEQSAVAAVRDGTVTIAPAALPADWSADSTAHAAALRSVLALHEARSVERVSGTLVDVDGGWDVGLGNVVLGADGVPECVAHGLLQSGPDGVWVCEQCGARALATGG